VHEDLHNILVRNDLHKLDNIGGQPQSDMGVWANSFKHRERWLGRNKPPIKCLIGMKPRRDMYIGPAVISIALRGAQQSEGQRQKMRGRLGIPTIPRKSTCGW